MSASVCVVIPLYKREPSANELRSVRRACQIFSGRDIYYVIPDCLDVSAYPVQMSHNFDRCYFQSLEGYSELCCSRRFYESFRDYDYMLICQPDCWVFRDDLDKFCAMGYDYIGAPWPVMPGIPEDGVGNGGFCLRRVRRFIELTRQLRDCYFHPEDRFWCIDMGYQLNIAPLDVAAHFSLEHDPERFYNAAGKVTPMGCHKPWRFDYDRFWKARKVPAFIEG